MKTNKDVYQTVEYQSWAHREQLITAERVLITKYLQKDISTLEAGTAGGRILLAMDAMGYRHLNGYDFVPEFIAEAKLRDKEQRINFSVMDASSLTYDDKQFGQIIYLQQILSLIPNVKSRQQAISESYRVLRNRGIAIFSVCCFPIRASQFIYKIFIIWIKILRCIFRKNVSIQNLPWLKLGGRFNFRSLLDYPPYVYWFDPSEFCNQLVSAGYQIVGVSVDSMLDKSQNAIVECVDDIDWKIANGHFYVVCRKQYNED